MPSGTSSSAPFPRERTGDTSKWDQNMESQALMHFGNVSKANYSPKRNHRIMIKQSVLLGLQPHSSNTSGAAVRVSPSPPQKKLINIPWTQTPSCSVFSVGLHELILHMVLISWLEGWSIKSPKHALAEGTTALWLQTTWGADLLWPCELTWKEKFITRPFGSCSLHDTECWFHEALMGFTFCFQNNH